MSELSNQECRDLPGSLSDRGCYFDKDGKVIDGTAGAVSFSCLDCGRVLDRFHAFSIIEMVKGKKVVRPVCAVCNIKREEKEDGNS